MKKYLVITALVSSILFCKPSYASNKNAESLSKFIAILSKKAEDAGFNDYQSVQERNQIAQLFSGLNTEFDAPDASFFESDIWDVLYDILWKHNRDREEKEQDDKVQRELREKEIEREDRYRERELQLRERELEELKRSNDLLEKQIHWGLSKAENGNNDSFHFNKRNK